MIARAERAGLGIAVVGHALLFAALSLGWLATTTPPAPVAQPIDVQLVDEVGKTDTTPEPAQTAPAPSVAPEAGLSADAAPVPPQPVAQTPQPPVQKPAPAPKPAPATPSPAKAAAAKPAPPAIKPAMAPPRGSRLGHDFLKGLADTSTPGTATAARVTVGPAQMASLVSAIRRQVQPCADRITSPGPDANLITTKLNLRLNRDGTLAAAPSVVSQSGVNDDNGRYARRVGELAASAFVRCAPFELPDDLYDGWKNVNLNYKLPD